MYGGSAKSKIGGLCRKIKICEGGQQFFPFSPPQDLNWNSAKVYSGQFIYSLTQHFIKFSLYSK